MPDRSLSEESALRMLEHLHTRMIETSRESNSFKARFHYGGLVAVAALLNLDLVLLKLPVAPPLRITILVLTGILLLFLSVWYFNLVARHAVNHDENYRKTKHKRPELGEVRQLAYRSAHDRCGGVGN